jgi:hypothetical protein
MQGINVFASTAARDAAITSPQEGQFAFTKDTNGLWYYDGAAWVASGATGDIEGVTAGIGISGGGTSGTVTVTNSMATAIDAKGDLIGGTGADTFSRLAVGANDTVLTADSTAATGLKWATAASGGLPNATSYSPPTSGFTIGNGTITTYYISSGDTVFYYGKITFGSTTSYSAGWKINLPVSAASTVGSAFFYGAGGVGTFRDASAAVNYWIQPGCFDANNLAFFIYDTASAYPDSGSFMYDPLPVTAASGDEITFSIWYRKA